MKIKVSRVVAPKRQICTTIRTRISTKIHTGNQYNSATDSFFLGGEMQNFKIISGGQVGVDRFALDWAIKHNVPHGGWCPKGRRSEDGVIPTCYDLQETTSQSYNALQTIIFLWWENDMYDHLLTPQN